MVVRPDPRLALSRSTRTLPNRSLLQSDLGQRREDSVFDRDVLRATIAEWLDRTGPRSALNELSDLGAVHFEVLEMLSDAILELHRAGYSKADIHLALSEDVVFARYAARRETGT
jgi:hypothetical protein